LGAGQVAPKPQDACALPREAIMGRPTKTEPRTKQLNLSLTVSEFERVRERAQSVGMRPVHFGRALVLDERTKLSSISNAESPLNRLFYTQLSRLGNNLNQLVRHVHRYGGSPPPELEALLRDIRRLLTRRAPR
jgi:hypothetical protein